MEGLLNCVYHHFWAQLWKQYEYLGHALELATTDAPDCRVTLSSLIPLSGLPWRTHRRYFISTCVRKICVCILSAKMKFILKKVFYIRYYSCVLFTFWSHFPDSNGFWHQEHNTSFLALEAHCYSLLRIGKKNWLCSLKYLKKPSLITLST